MARKVYGVYNNTRKERYYGTTKGLVPNRIREHRSRRTGALQKWNWGKDKIRYRTIAHLPDKKAIRKAHKLELAPTPPGWRTIQTGGK